MPGFCCQRSSKAFAQQIYKFEISAPYQPFTARKRIKEIESINQVKDHSKIVTACSSDVKFCSSTCSYICEVTCELLSFTLQTVSERRFHSFFSLKIIEAVSLDVFPLS